MGKQIGLLELLKIIDGYGELFEYDMKNLMMDYYETYREEHKNDSAYEEVLENAKKCSEGFGTEKWRLYKKDPYKSKSYQFDCDSSNETCQVMTDVYKVLWNYSNQNKSCSLKGFENGLVPDTMNSFKITYNIYDKADGLSNIFAKDTSTLGNFILVPKGYNAFRGIHSSIRDYWDLSLNFMKYNTGWINVSENEETKKERKSNFNRYINFFFLWDYVDCVNGEYEIKGLFTSHKDIVSCKNTYLCKCMSPSKIECEEFYKNVIFFIRKRGLFMNCMIEIALMEDDELQDNGKNKENLNINPLYTKIVDEVFKKDCIYNGYADVIEKIKQIITKHKFTNELLTEK